MINMINEFRSSHGIEPIKYRDHLIDHYCMLHCFEMAKRCNIFHAPECYLEGWGEAVAIMQYCYDWKKQVIFDILGVSEGHRDILLHNNKIAFAEHINNGIVYVTIRGRND